MNDKEMTNIVKIIGEITSDLESGKITLSSALLKSKRIYTGLSNKELEEFVRLETEGSFTDENLPDYRKKYAEPIGVFQHYLTREIQNITLQYSKFLEEAGIEPDIIYKRPIPFSVPEMEEFVAKAETSDLMIEFTLGQLDTARQYLKQDESNGWILISGYFKLGFSTFTQILAIIKDRFIEILLNLENELTGDTTRENQQFFEEGKTFDALFSLSDKIRQAKKGIILIDGYIDEKTLRILSYKETGVSLSILTNQKSISDNLTIFIDSFNHQFKNLSVKCSNAFHDRFLIIDEKFYYHIGASIKDAGRKSFMISLIEEKFLQEAIMQKFNKEWN